MAEPKFFYKEALAHGWSITKKYWKTILLFVLAYFLFTVANGMLDYFAGSKLEPREVRVLYKEADQANRLYEHLQSSGYISPFGHVEPKLQQLASADELELPVEFQLKRPEIYQLLNEQRYRLPFPKTVFYLLAFLFWVGNTLISIGFIKVYLMMSRDEESTMNDLFANGSIFIPYLLASICYGLMVVGGVLLLIVPGIMLMVMFQMYPYLIIDKGMGPIEALKRSRVITKGQRWRLVVFGGLLVLLNIAGFLCLLVGLFFTMSISYVAAAYVYDKLENAPDVAV